MTEDELFSPRLIKDDAKALCEEYNYGNEADFEKAGEAIRNGDYGRQHFEAIFRWKTKNRGKSRTLKNSDSEIAEALRIAVVLKSPKLAISVLRGLAGVEIPVASAIMTAIKPKDYTILDFRAAEALGEEPGQTWSIPYYERYLAFCKDLAAEWGMSLRDLDRALWMWSKKNGSA